MKKNFTRILLGKTDDDEFDILNCGRTLGELYEKYLSYDDYLKKFQKITDDLDRNF